MSREACTKYDLRVKLAMDFKNSNELWVIMAQTTAWEDEEAPTSPSPSVTTMTEPFLAIRPSIISLARDVSLEDYNLLSSVNRAMVSIGDVLTYLELVDDDEAVDKSARYLYISTLYDPVLAGHPTFGSFRSYWLAVNLVPSAGYETNYWLIPEHIDEYGLIGYENSGTAVNDGNQISMPIILEFR